MIGISGSLIFSPSNSAAVDLSSVSMFSGSNLIIDIGGNLRAEALAGLVPMSSLNLPLVSTSVYSSFPTAFASMFTYAALGEAPWYVLKDSVTYDNLGQAPWSALSNAVTYTNLGQVPLSSLSNITYKNLGPVPWSALSNSISYSLLGPVPFGALSNVSYTDFGPVPWSSLSNAVTYSNLGQPDLSIMQSWFHEGFPTASIPPSALSNLTYNDIRGKVPSSALNSNVLTMGNLVTAMVALGYGPPPQFNPCFTQPCYNRF
jgi:hypothetical protein